MLCERNDGRRFATAARHDVADDDDGNADFVRFKDANFVQLLVRKG